MPYCAVAPVDEITVGRVFQSALNRGSRRVVKAHVQRFSLHLSVRQSELRSLGDHRRLVHIDLDHVLVPGVLPLTGERVRRPGGRVQRRSSGGLPRGTRSSGAGQLVPRGGQYSPPRLSARESSTADLFLLDQEEIMGTPV